MDFDWRHFPSLTSLRAFEAASRLRNFSAAARALNVTHAAVVQQVRGLETTLGYPLLYRDGRGLALTAKGVKLAKAVNEGFQVINTALFDLGATDKDAPLRVTMTPAFAAQWLMPRLGTFWSAHPEVPLSLHPDEHLVDLRRQPIDLAIRFGSGAWPGVDAEFLTAAHYVVVGAPALLKGRKCLSADEMSHLPWVIEDGWPEALAWLKSFGLIPEAMAITYMPTEELALSAARQGYGLHVEAAALVQHDVLSGALVIVGKIPDNSLAYYAVTLPGPKRPEVKTFISWLKAAI